jgi:hypothetical protein
MKREIEFNFAKWGQDGVVVQSENSHFVAEMHLNKISGTYYGYYENGMYFTTINTALRMYEEVKPREFWMNLYSNGLIAILDSKEQADDVGRSFVFVNPDKRVETIKVREVLD